MELFVTSLIGGLLALDTAAVLQILISQPLVSGTVLGYFLGDVTLGLHIGAILQLLFINQIPVGAAKVPAGNLATVMSVILIFQLDKVFENYYHLVMLAVIVYTLLVSYFGTNLVTFIRNWNISLLHRAIKGLEQGKVSILGRINLMAILLHFAIVVVSIIIGVKIGEFLISHIIPMIPQSWDSFARYVEIAVVGSGVGLTLQLYNSKKNVFAILIGGLAGLLFFVII